MGKTYLTYLRFAAIAVLLVAATMLHAVSGTASDSTTAGKSPLTASQVVDQMLAHNATRAQELKSYESRRIYRVEYHGFPTSKTAEMEVAVKFTAPATKEFTVISQKGSGLLVSRVLKKLLESESEASDEKAREHTALSLANYQFALDHTEQEGGRLRYVLNVTPLREDKFLYRGKIWVDGDDFAVARIEAEPARNPSFWLKKTEIKHQYTKVGDFWLPAKNVSESKIRIGGHATLEIEYIDYRVSPGERQVAGTSVQVPSSAPSQPANR
ncbi:MAG TPA: hypothetical protein VKZ53_23170 [Candidatus Angelobacter sp.]|nr:hypothetical protein [Candidatus Angelobacter sp.]